ncbi:hypothetical protein [Polaribacter sejongensis]|uniref:hypothetical protein n=1 Tax=Polaribacter sejongensis TaxID=985043 RepID=UPI0035A6A8FB
MILTTNGRQCISRRNFSTNCEQGIDARTYPQQKGGSIIRYSCVICSVVYLRGGLNLEIKPEEGPINPTDILLGNDLDLMDLMNNTK